MLSYTRFSGKIFIAVLFEGCDKGTKAGQKSLGMYCFRCLNRCNVSNESDTSPAIFSITLVNSSPAVVSSRPAPSALHMTPPFLYCRVFWVEGLVGNMVDHGTKEWMTRCFIDKISLISSRTIFI